MPGPEEGVVDAGRHDADPPGLAAVQRGNLLGLDRARRQHGVGALDDGRLGLGPPVRHVGLDLLGHRLRLDPVEGVEGAHERQVQLVLYDVPRQAGQPVVGVDGGVGQVGAALRPARGHGLEHPSGELVHHRRQGLLGDGVARPGGHVVHPQPRLEVDHGRQVPGPGSCEDVASDAAAGQRGGELAHIDVHAAAVARARLGQWGGVQGEDGEPAHGAEKPTGSAELRSGTPGQAPERGQALTWWSEDGVSAWTPSSPSAPGGASGPDPRCSPCSSS